jgi:HK97 family phage portal protein
VGGRLQQLGDWLGLTSRDVSIVEQIPSRAASRGQGSILVDAESAMRSSAYWAALRLRANLISSLPVDVYRKLPGGLSANVVSPPVLVSPGGGRTIRQWLWATQYDLDRFGNAFGLITARDGAGRPAQIELRAVRDVKVMSQGADVTGYRIGRIMYDPIDVWHERQYWPSGLPVGLSPLAYAAWSIGGYLSAQQFGLDFFGSGGMPSGVLKNTTRTINDAAATAEIKARFKAATSNRDLFVTGMDWEWTPAQSEGASMAFIEDKRYGLADIARYLDVPSDLLDVVQSGSSITYANVTSRMVQLLVTSLGPAIGNREEALGTVVAAPRFVKLNSDALLRMDPETRTRVILARVAGRTLDPNEARALDDLPPLTPEQIDLITTLLPATPIATKPEVKA